LLRDAFEQQIRRNEVDLLLVSDGVCRGRLDEMPQECLFEDRFMLCAWRDNAAVQPDLSITEFEALPYVQYGMGRETGFADRSLEWLNIRPKVELRTESQLLVPFVLTESPLVALVPKRLAQMTQVQAELKIIKPPFNLPPIRQSAVWHLRRNPRPCAQMAPRPPPTSCCLHPARRPGPNNWVGHGLVIGARQRSIRHLFVPTGRVTAHSSEQQRARFRSINVLP
jgi:DNA-binding transcriptional LysR family regulator